MDGAGRKRGRREGKGNGVGKIDLGERQVIERKGAAFVRVPVVFLT